MPCLLFSTRNRDGLSSINRHSLAHHCAIWCRLVFPQCFMGDKPLSLFSCADTTGVYRNRAMHCCSSLFHRFPLPISTSPGSHHSPLSIDRILFVHSILSIGHWPQFTWGWRSNRQRDRSTTGLRFWHKNAIFDRFCSFLAFLMPKSLLFFWVPSLYHFRTK